MPFAATTRDRVMGALSLPVVPSYTQVVDDALTSAQTYGGEATVTRIEGYLTQYEAAETSLNQGAGEAGLIQADVLRWSETGKQAGLTKEMGRLRRLIAQSLALTELLSGGSGVKLIR